jgi:NAD(P)-dependent dehydrogenase (short-subunit alcohol dehydrogenase family)
MGAEMTKSRGVAILVGAGDAIGAAVARRFAQGGYAVCICRRDAAKSQALVDELKAAGQEIHSFSVDARQEKEVQDLFARVESEIGPIEVCLFNAGSNVNKPLIETTEKLFFKAWELACYAGFLVGREAARVMVPRGRGTILFTGATASLRGGKGFAAFSAAKFGLRAVAQAMARELGPKNIHVVHLIIDAGVDSEAIHARMKAASGIEAKDIPPDSLAKTSSIAEAYWFAHQQTKDGWTHELDLRPAGEKW